MTIVVQRFGSIKVEDDEENELSEASNDVILCSLCRRHTIHPGETVLFFDKKTLENFAFQNINQELSLPKKHPFSP